MNKEEAKKELIKRYKYIYENAHIILAPHMYKQTKDERNKLNKQFIEEGLIDLVTDKLSIYLKPLPDFMLLHLESFLLSDIKMEDSKLYKEVEYKKNSKEFMLLVKDGLKLVDEKNKDINNEALKLNVDSWQLLTVVYDFIKRQTGFISNKGKKLRALDEYFRINRYKNDGNLYTSGKNMNMKDINNSPNYSALVTYNRIIGRNENDTGLEDGDFINIVSNESNHYKNNLSILTEKEKQEIYLSYHDELPCDLETTCKPNKDNTAIMDGELTNLNNMEPCFLYFNIKEEEIFVDNDGKYYHLCPHCGYIVNIDEKLLSQSVKKKIDDRCKNDPQLFKKMYLYSKLFNLDIKSKGTQKRLIKK